MLKSLALKQGDKIGIISTARHINTDEITFADNVFKSWGLCPVYGRTISSQQNQYAGDDALRADDLQKMLNDADIKAIVCARGGYGTIRIIDKIDFTQFMTKPKLLCGFSDVTVLHTHINDKLGLPSIHSCMPLTFQKNSPEALETLKNALFGFTTDYTFENTRFTKKGQAEGTLLGGNLSILYSLLGTKYGFSTTGKILFIEDVDEYLYHIDRMMMSLKLAGKLSNINGLIVGGMTQMKDNKIPFGKKIEEIILDAVYDLNIPVCFGFPAGHQDDNRSLLLGEKVSLEVVEGFTSLNYL